MAVAESAPRLAPEIRELLQRLRGRIRRYVWLEGTALAVAAAVVCFWLLHALDWWQEPPPRVLRGLLAVCLVGVLLVFWRYAFRRAFVPLADESLALLIERHHGELQEGLITVVELAERDAQLEPLGREMFAHTARQTAQAAAHVQVEQLFNHRRLRLAVTAAASLALTVIAYGLLAPRQFLFGVRRLATLTSEPWPRDTKLSIEGFRNNEAVIARGSDLPITVRADMSGTVPQVVYIRYRTAEGARGREPMSREGNAQPGRDAYQEYRYTFEGVLSDRTFEVLGGDARLRGLRIRVVDSPTITQLKLHCTFPEYLGRAQVVLPVSGTVQLPVGTHLVLEAQANKKLVRATVDRVSEGQAPVSQQLEIRGADARRFRLALGSLQTNTVLNFTLLDADGIDNSRQPVRLKLVAQPDQAPLVRCRLHGIGTAITPRARLPWQGTVEDDYGIAALSVEYAVGQQQPADAALPAPSTPQTKLTVDAAWEVEPLQLTPGQQLVVALTATDNRHLPDVPSVAEQGPNVARGERFLLDVVTPEKLRALLEARELNLRQRFETIIEEVTGSREALAAMEFQPAGAAASDPQEQPRDGAQAEPPAPPTPSSPGQRDSREPEDGTKPDDAAAPDDASEPAQAPSPERLLQRRSLRVQRTRQDSEKNAAEVAGLADAFDEIQAELVNNRLDTEELRIRLQDQIAAPLRRIAQQMFPELQQRLESLQAVLADAAKGPKAQAHAVAQLDAILVEMLRVRDKMLELESFNELVDLVRSVLAEQEALEELTRSVRAQSLRSLLEDEEGDAEEDNP